MPQRTASIVTFALVIAFFSLSVEQAGAMSRHHHHDGGGSQSGNGGTVEKFAGSAFHSIDAQGYMTPVPEPSTIVLLGSGVAALGLWRWKKKQ